MPAWSSRCFKLALLSIGLTGGLIAFLAALAAVGGELVGTPAILFFFLFLFGCGMGQLAFLCGVFSFLQLSSSPRLIKDVSFPLVFLSFGSTPLLLGLDLKATWAFLLLVLGMELLAFLWGVYRLVRFRQPGSFYALLGMALAWAGAVFLVDFATTISGHGREDCTVEFTVIESETGLPVGNARVRVFQEIVEKEKNLEGTTNSDGQVALVVEAKTASTLSAIRVKHRSVSFIPWLLEVSAPGYKKLKCPLWQRTEHVQNSWEDSPVKIQIELEKLDSGHK